MVIHHKVAPPKYYYEDDSSGVCFNKADGRRNGRTFLVLFAVVAIWLVFMSAKNFRSGASGNDIISGIAKEHQQAATEQDGTSSAASDGDIVDFAPIQEDAIQVLPEWHNHGRISDEANKLLRQREEKEKESPPQAEATQAGEVQKAGDVQTETSEG